MNGTTKKLFLSLNRSTERLLLSLSGIIYSASVSVSVQNNWLSLPAHGIGRIFPFVHSTKRLAVSVYT